MLLALALSLLYFMPMKQQVNEERQNDAIAEKGDLVVIIDKKLCKGCGICIELCPKKVLAFDPLNKSYFAHPDQCIRCGMCELWCPDYAIFVEKNDK